jgi:hypothetical protein
MQRVALMFEPSSTAHRLSSPGFRNRTSCIEVEEAFSLKLKLKLKLKLNGAEMYDARTTQQISGNR